MTKSFGNLSPRTAVALVVLALLVLAAGGYLLLISPKRAQAAELEAETAAVEAKIAEYRSAAFVKALPAIRAAEVFRLAKAMPERSGMAEVILELNRVATDTGIVFESITPQAPVSAGTYSSVPITLAFRGNFYTLSDFLFRLRQLVHVRKGKLVATGRMFAVSGVSFTEGNTQKFPHVTAELTVDAFVFGSGAQAPLTEATGDPAGTGDGSAPAQTTPDPAQGPAPTEPAPTAAPADPATTTP
jgi:hypothetical protein